MIISAIHERIVGKITFPLTQYLYNRKGISTECRSGMAAEKMDPELIIEMQLRYLRRTIEHAYRYVPYYKKLFRRVGICSDDIKSLSGVSSIPALSRDDVINAGRELLDQRYIESAAQVDQSSRGPGEPMPFARFKKFPLVRNTSSGSTGAPTVFYEDGTVSANSWANEMRVKRWFGLQPGIREARLVRISSDFIMKNKLNIIRQLLWNQMVLPGVNLTEKEYRFILEQLMHFKPKVIWAFTAAAAGVAKYAIDNEISLQPNSPALIITWAAPLYEHERDIIQRGFGGIAGNIYGMREVGHIGAFCPNGSLHVFQDSHLLETDEKGELLVTFLRQTPMPFIRYRTGDLGEISNERCACGRTLQVIKQFHGRTSECYTTPDGRMFSPNFWCRTFMDARLTTIVRRFQIIYAKDHSIKVRMLLPEDKRSQAENLLKQIISQNFGFQTSVVFEYPDEIAPQISGKYQMVINELKSS